MRLPALFFSSLARQALSLLLVLVAALASCRSDRDEIPPPGHELDGLEYYPVQRGQFHEYDVTDTLWALKQGVPHDSVVHYQLREELDTIYQSAAGELTYRLLRSRRDGVDTVGGWRPDSVMAIVAGTQFVRQTFANLPTVELVFAVREGKTWNPNMFNTTAVSTSRRYERVGQAFTLPESGRRFDKTIRVVDEPQISAIALREQEAVYAWNIGRVYRKRRILNYCNQPGCPLGTNFIVTGFVREERLRNWGPR